MSLHARRRYRHLGLPEFLLFCAMVLAVAPLTVLWVRLNQPEWPPTGGWVVSGEIQKTHYNAQDYRQKARVAYEYLVGSVSYQGEFVGLWPDVGSPNALPPQEIESLTQHGHRLTVYYDPRNPSHSRLHTRGNDDQLGHILISGCCIALAGIYSFVLYPAWRRR